MNAPNDERVKLYDVANIYVTHRAASQYAEYAGLELEAARRELTRLMLDAVEVAGDRGRWRRRSKRHRVDVQARIDLDDDLALVVDVQIRPHGNRARR